MAAASTVQDTELIEPIYYSDIQYALSARNCWIYFWN
jgi:hypothetical protein